MKSSMNINEIFFLGKWKTSTCGVVLVKIGWLTVRLIEIKKTTTPPLGKPTRTLRFIRAKWDGSNSPVGFGLCESDVRVGMEPEQRRVVVDR